MSKLVYVNKSTRHQKIIGDFGEQLICNWLSRSGFEVSIVDHTGIDVLAYSPSEKIRLGISIKSRTRNVGKEKTHVNLYKMETGHAKIMDACKAFGAEPWIGVYVETAEYADLFLSNLEYYLANYYKKGNTNVDLKMGQNKLEEYNKDDKIKHIHIDFTPLNWFSDQK